MRACAVVLWAVVLAVGQTRSADDILKQALVLAQENRFEDARQLLEDGRRRFPSDARFATELAGISYRKKDRRRAQSYLREALRKAPEDQYANSFLASLYLLDGNVPAAVKYWNRVGRPRIADIGFTPMPPLRPELRERLSAVSSGQVLTRERLRRTETNLARTQIFSDYGIELTPGEDSRYDLNIRTVPRAGQALKWWWRVLPLMRGLAYEHVNLDFFNVRGNTTNVLSLVRWDSNKRRVAMQVSGPWALSRYFVSLDGRDERWDLRRTYVGSGLSDVSMRKFEGVAGVSFLLGDTLQWAPAVAVSRRQFQRGDGSRLFDDSWLAEIRNRLDACLLEMPDRRVRIDGWAVLRSGRFFRTEGKRFLSPEAGVKARWLPPASGEKYEVTAQIRAGGAFGDVPLDELHALGMERDSETWLRGHVGTRDGRKGNAPLGSRYVLVNTGVARELIRVPFLRVLAGPFFDLGRAGEPGGRLGSHGMLYDVGLQVTLKVLGGVVISGVYGRDLRDGRGALYSAVSR